MKKIYIPFNGKKTKLRALAEYGFAACAISVGILGITHSDSILTYLSGYRDRLTNGDAAGLLTRESGGVRLQPKGKVFWKDLLNSSQNVQGGDTILTARDGFARLQFRDGTVIRLSPDSLLVVKSEAPAPEKTLSSRVWSWALTKEPKLKLELKKGSLQVKVKANSKPAEFVLNEETVKVQETSSDAVMVVNSNLETTVRRAVETDFPELPPTGVALPEENVAAEIIPPPPEEPAPSPAVVAVEEKLTAQIQEALPIPPPEPAPAPLFARPSAPRVPKIVAPVEAPKVVEASKPAPAPVVPAPAVPSEGERTVRDLASISMSDVRKKDFSLQLATGLASYGLTQGAGTENALDFAAANGRSFAARFAYAPAGRLGAELGFSNLSGKINSKNPADDLRYQSSTLSAEAVYPFASAEAGASGVGFETNVRGGFFHFASPFLLNDGDRLYVQKVQAMAGGVGLGGKLKVGRNWLGEAMVRSQRPFSESSEGDRFQSQTKLLFDSMVSASYVTDSGVRMGLTFQQTYQSRKYQLQQLDGTKESAEHSLKAYGANATLGLDF